MALDHQVTLSVSLDMDGCVFHSLEEIVALYETRSNIINTGFATLADGTQMPINSLWDFDEYAFKTVIEPSIENLLTHIESKIQSLIKGDNTHILVQLFVGSSRQDGYIDALNSRAKPSAFSTIQFIQICLEKRLRLKNEYGAATIDIELNKFLMNDLKDPGMELCHYDDAIAALKEYSNYEKFRHHWFSITTAQQGHKLDLLLTQMQLSASSEENYYLFYDDNHKEVLIPLLRLLPKCRGAIPESVNCEILQYEGMEIQPITSVVGTRPAPHADVAECMSYFHEKVEDIDFWSDCFAKEGRYNLQRALYESGLLIADNKQSKKFLNKPYFTELIFTSFNISSEKTVEVNGTLMPRLRIPSSPGREGLFASSGIARTPDSGQSSARSNSSFSNPPTPRPL